MGRLMWKVHYNVSDEHIYYVVNYLKKPFNIGILECAERVSEMFEMAKLIPRLSRNNE